MKVFLWVLLVHLAMAIIGRLVWLAKGVFPQRTAKQEAFNVGFNAAWMAWVVWLLKDAV